MFIDDRAYDYSGPVGVLWDIDTYDLIQKLCWRNNLDLRQLWSFWVWRHLNCFFIHSPPPPLFICHHTMPWILFFMINIGNRISLSCQFIFSSECSNGTSEDLTYFSSPMITSISFSITIFIFSWSRGNFATIRKNMNKLHSISLIVQKIRIIRSCQCYLMLDEGIRRTRRFVFNH